MADLSIRGLDDRVKDQLRIRAAQHGRSMEAEVRSILERSVDESDHPLNLGEAILARFGALGGVDLDLPARDEAPRAAELGT